MQALRFILIALSLGGTTISATTESVDGRRIVIIDGDTIDIRGERIRILNIDSPESFRSRCEAELKLALQTKERLAELLRPVLSRSIARAKTVTGARWDALRSGKSDVGGSSSESVSRCPGRMVAKPKERRLKVSRPSSRSANFFV